MSLFLTHFLMFTCHMKMKNMLQIVINHGQVFYSTKVNGLSVSGNSLLDTVVCTE